jgi:hypothetical protein
VWLKIELSDTLLSTEQQTSKLPGLRFSQQFCCKIKFSGSYADSLAKQFPLLRRIVVPSSLECWSSDRRRCLTLMIKELKSIEISKSFYPATKCNIPEHLILPHCYA